MAGLTRRDYETEVKRPGRPAAAAPTPTPTPSPTAAAPSSPQQQQTTELTPRQAAEGVEEATRPDGPVTAVGEFLGDMQPSNWIPNAADTINNLIPEDSPLKGATQFLADNTYTVKEQQEKSGELADKLEEDGKSLEANTIRTAVGASAGAEAGMALPATVAARIANQNAPWSDPPAAIANNPYGETAFAIAEILVPTLLTGGVAGGALPGGVMLAGESALETATQDSAEDLLAGRELAIQLGNAANNLGYDGNQLTIDLIEGTEPNAQAINAVAGFLMNLGINFGAEQLFKRVGKLLGRKSTKQAEEIAEATGRDADTVQLELDLINKPDYRPTAEPHDVQTVDNMASVGAPSGGKKYISEPHLVKKLRDDFGLASDGMDAAGMDYFTNYLALSTKEGLHGVLKEVTKSIKRIRPASMDIDEMAIRAKGFLDNYLDDAGNLNIPAAIEEMIPENLIVPIQPGKATADFSDADLFYRDGQVTQEGFIAGAVIAEELATRMSMAARGASNLDSAGIDFSNQVENFLQLTELAEQILIPLRRGKRRWFTEGAVQQQKVIAGLTDPSQALDGTDFLSKDPEAWKTRIRVDTKKSVTARVLWEQYKAGDPNAGKLLKDYLAMLGASKPSAAISNVDNLGTALYSALNRSAEEAGTRMYYAYMLTRISPQTAAFSSNILNLIKQPLGLFLNGNRAEAVGQIIGGMSALWDATNYAATVFKNGKGGNTGNRTGRAIISLGQASREQDKLYEGLRKQLAAEGAPIQDRLFARFQHLRVKMSLHPIMDVATRGLMAQDEWGKTLFAAQYATGRAWKQAADANWGNALTLGFNNTPEFHSLIKQSFDEAFKDGVQSGIRDPEILEGAKRITFQQNIPIDGNQVDKAFLALQQAADESKFWRWVSPFTRMTYSSLEQAGVLLAGAIPGRLGRKALTELIPRYKKTLAGEFGDVAKMQLEADLAFAEAMAISTGGLAAMGMMTGNTPPEGLPPTSFIVPAPGTEQGWVGIPYGRLQPIATPMSIIADLVTNVRDEVIDEGNYAKFMEQTMQSMFLATLDQTFTTGMMNTAQLFDVKNWSDYTLTTAVRSLSAPAAGVIPIGGYGGLVRMVTSWVNPYKTVSRVNDDPIENLFLSLRESFFSGAGNPILHDPLTGKPSNKVATLGGNDNYWGAVLGSMLNEVLVPGKVQDAREDFIMDNFNKVGYEFDIGNLRTYRGIPLTATQISQLSKDLYSDGQLPQRLKAYFNSPKFKKSYADYLLFRSDSKTGNTSDGTRAGMIRSRIHEDISKVVREAKQAAVNKGSLSKDKDFQTKIRRSNLGLPLNMPAPTDNSSQLPLVPTR